MHSSPVASQEGQETAKGGDPVSASAPADKQRRTRVWLKCESCGKAYAMPLWDVERRKRQSEARTRLPSAREGGGYGILRFCRKACRRDRAIAYIRENPRAQSWQIQGMFDVSAPTVTRWRKAAEEK
jgi:hypothetical protein